MTKIQATNLVIEFRKAHKAYIDGKLTKFQSENITMKYGHWFWKGYDMWGIYNLILT